MSAIETSDLKLSGDLVQTSKNCVCEAWANVQLLLQQISASVVTRLKGVVGAYSGGNLGTVTIV